MNFVKNLMGWVNNSDDEDDMEDYQNDIGVMIEEKNEREEYKNNTTKELRKTKSSENVVDIKTANSHQFSVVVVRPKKFENVIEIADNLKLGKTVALNFEQTDDETTTRLVDFLSGVTYALNAELTKISTHACIITPNNVYVLSELVDELEGTGMF